MDDMRMSTPTSEEFIEQHLKPFLQAKDEAIARLNREQDAFATELMDVKDQLRKLSQQLQQANKSLEEKNDEYRKLFAEFEKLNFLQQEIKRKYEKKEKQSVQGSQEIEKLRAELKLTQETKEFSAAVQFGNTREMFKLFIMFMHGYLKQNHEVSTVSPQQVAGVVKENCEKLLQVLINQSVKDSHEFSDIFVQWLTNEKERIAKSKRGYDASKSPFLIQRYLPNYK